MENLVQGGQGRTSEEVAGDGYVAAFVVCAGAWFLVVAAIVRLFC